MVARVGTIPSNITRQEQLAMWAIMGLDESTLDKAILERPGIGSYFAEWQYLKNPEGKKLFVGRVCLQIDEFAAMPAGAKPWIAAQDTPGGVLIPSYYGSN